jgi:hypothetical protein
MPDDISPLAERRYEPRLATEEDLEFLMARIAALPTRRELIHFGVWVALGFCVLALVGLKMWMDWVWACSPL